MSQTVSIIGCGWLGLPCAIRLVEAGYQIKGSTTTKEKLSKIAAHDIQAFLLQLDTAEPSQELFDCDILFINFPPGRGATNIVPRYEQRIGKVIQAAEKANVRKIIFASTTGVYSGVIGDPIVHEQVIPQPARDSAKAMLAGEKLLSSYTDQLTILRFAGLMGPGRNAANFLSGKKDMPNPDNAVNLVRLDDCVEVVTSIIDNNIFGHLFNVVADEHPSRKVYYTQLTTLAGLIPPTFNPIPSSPDKIVSNDKIKKALNFSFKHPNPFHF